MCDRAASFYEQLRRVSLKIGIRGVGEVVALLILIQLEIVNQNFVLIRLNKNIVICENK